MAHKATFLLLGVTTVLGVGMGLWLVEVSGLEIGNRDAPVKIDELKRHVSYLASDPLGGRGPGTEGDRKAAEYLAEKLKASGLRPLFKDPDGSPSFFQPFVVRTRKTTGTSKLLLRFADRTEPLEFGKDVSLTWIDASYQRPFRLAYVGYGIREPDLGWDDLAGVDVEDRCVILDVGSPPEMTDWPPNVQNRYRTIESASLIKAKNIREAGATCILGILSPHDSSLPWDQMIKQNRSSFTDVPGKGGQSFTDILVLSLSRQWTEKLFQNEPFDPFSNRGRYHSFELSTSIDVDVTVSRQAQQVATRNVGAWVAGTDPSLEEEFVTLSAHVDGLGTVGGKIYNGANDNAASVAAMLEAARLQALRPTRRPVAFLFFSGEEMGLFGSRYFLDASPIPIDRLAVNVNYEMVGGDMGRGFNVNGTTSLSSDLRPILDAANRNGPRAHLDFRRDQRNGGGWVSRRSDHYNFYLKGIPFLYLVGGGSSYYHKVGDDTETVDFDRTLDAAWLAFELAQEFGNRDRRPGIDMPLPDDSP